MKAKYRIAFFGSSLVSAYWNGAATYYRGILKALHDRGYRITFYEPDAFDRQRHRDIGDPSYARSVVYEAAEEAARRCLREAADADILIKASGVGVFDGLLEREILELKNGRNKVLFWDVDAPATLDRMAADADDPFRPLVGAYDFILTYGGGPRVVRRYKQFGAGDCVPVYNALDPGTHFPVEPQPAFEADLGFLGNRMPDREERVFEFFYRAAELRPDKTFLLGGSGWGENVPYRPNIRCVGHVYTSDLNAFNCTPLAVLNISRRSMARCGYSPATRVFEAAGAGACLITDKWRGIEMFLEPNEECFVAATGEEVAQILNDLTPEKARLVGQQARERILAEHTYTQRALQLDEVLSRSAPVKQEAIR